MGNDAQKDMAGRRSIAEVSTEVVRLSREIRKSCRRDKKQRIDRLCEEMDEAEKTEMEKSVGMRKISGGNRTTTTTQHQHHHNNNTNNTTTTTQQHTTTTPPPTQHHNTPTTKQHHNDTTTTTTPRKQQNHDNSNNTQQHTTTHNNNTQQQHTTTTHNNNTTTTTTTPRQQQHHDNNSNTKTTAATTTIDTTNGGKYKMGGRRQLTQTGTPSARPFLKASKGQNGKPCVIDTRKCSKQWKPRNLGKTRRPTEVPVAGGSRPDRLAPVWSTGAGSAAQCGAGRGDCLRCRSSRCSCAAAGMRRGGGRRAQPLGVAPTSGLRAVLPRARRGGAPRPSRVRGWRGRWESDSQVFSTPRY